MQSPHHISVSVTRPRTPALHGAETDLRVASRFLCQEECYIKTIFLKGSTILVAPEAWFEWNQA